MKRLLDTNACIQYLRGRSPDLIARLESIDPNDIYVCSIVKAELYFGAARSGDFEAGRKKADAFLSRFVSLVFDDSAANHYAQIRADLTARGTPVGPNDLLIAAICLANDVTLITNNVREFSRIRGLRVEVWK